MTVADKAELARVMRGIRLDKGFAFSTGKEPVAYATGSLGKVCGFHLRTNPAKSYFPAAPLV